MKRGLICAALLAALLGCIPAAFGTAWEQAEEQLEAYGASDVEDAAGDTVEQPLTLEIDLVQGLSDLADAGTAALSGLLREALRSGAMQLAVVLFALTASALCGVRSEALRSGVRLVAVLASAGLAAVDAGSLLTLGRETIASLDSFGQMLIPVLTTVSTAAGNPTGAAVRQTATLFCSDLLLYLIDRVLVPGVYLCLAAAVAAHVVENPGLSAAASLLRWAVRGLLVAVLTVYTTVLSFLTVSAGGTDALTAQLTKTAISTLVPVVGGILSETSETLLAGAALVRSAVGVFGVLAVLGLCLIPFLRLGVQYLVYKAVAVLASVLGDSGLGGLLGEISSAFGLMLGMTGSAALVLLIALFAAMSAALPT